VNHERRAAARRGVTLVEMLVTLAVLLLMMTAIVQIFQAATGSLSSAQAYQELDNQLRQLDATIRSDLNGVTCKLTPPNDPLTNPGYLEYGENEFPDVQGEDCDDYIRFTAKAPAGRPFTGRMWVPPTNPQTLSALQATNLFQAGFQPITITSEYAEIIYFVRNGNLYRRVLLVAPERQSSLIPTINNQATVAYGTPVPPNPPATLSLSFLPAGFGGTLPVSWQGMNDISAHPAPTGPDSNAAVLAPHNAIVLNTLAHLANRENRFAYQRFGNDFQGLATPGPDNLADEFNGDNVPDYYPTLYNGVLTNPNILIYEPFAAPGPFRNLMAFPYVFPGAYTRPQVLANMTAGWIHSPEPRVVDPTGAVHQFDGAGNDPLLYLQYLNHNPIDLGDNLPLPSSGQGGTQTWWGFPTWRETLRWDPGTLTGWNDPTVQLNVAQAQPFGLARRPAVAGPVADDVNLLPPMILPAAYSADFSFIRRRPDPYADGLGSLSAFWAGTGVAVDPLWSQSWEDDLIMTNVRSFDIKAYDNSRADYADLGWGDDVRITPAGTGTPFLYGNIGFLSFTWNGQAFDTLNQTFAHEGRMPPLVADLRSDAQFGFATYPLPTGNTYTGNIGDNQLGIVRLRRVWDSWSTDYTRAPATGVYLNKANPADPFNGFPWGPPYTPPIYPSYPPPYPAPLRGIQIQIRVTDPTNQRIKVLTIKHDFTDKL
jgi:prepilin-type N-terminal cleavage/methylation domain-containing protein